MFSVKSSSRKSGSSKALSLSSRTQIDCMDAGLSGVNGAKQIINLIRSRRTVTKLILGHNSLSDDGTILLFTFLSSNPGRKYPITEISLNGNRIGDRGLAAISAYLAGNVVIKELFLQDNLFTADSPTVARFAQSINQSRLRLLSLTTNRSLSDDFARLFFPVLSSHYLQELHLSAIGLTHHSAPHIAKFITSNDRCRLHTLKCNGNGLAFRGIRTIIRAIERANFSLTVVEMYSNNITSGQDSEDTDDDVDGESHTYSVEAWKETEQLLKRILARNSHLKKETKKEALQLLQYSRTVLLRPEQPFNYGSSATSPLTTGFPFRDLPTEVQLHILSFLAPLLSASQRVRVYAYASSPSTLPALLPSLSIPPLNSEPAVFSVCVPDPSVTMGFSEARRTPPVWTITNSEGGGGGCAPGKCMGRKSLLCHLEQQRIAWLECVECLDYDPRMEVEIADGV